MTKLKKSENGELIFMLTDELNSDVNHIICLCLGSGAEGDVISGDMSERMSQSESVLKLGWRMVPSSDTAALEPLLLLP